MGELDIESQDALDDCVTVALQLCVLLLEWEIWVRTIDRV